MSLQSKAYIYGAHSPIPRTKNVNDLLLTAFAYGAVVGGIFVAVLVLAMMEAKSW